jgi:hypothetical protein
MPTKTENTIDIKQPPSVFLEQFRHLQAVDEKSAAGAYRTVILGWFDLPFVRNSASAALLVKGMKE